MNTFELVVVKGSQRGQAYRLEGEEVVIGRHSSCQICIDDPTISRRHTMILRDSDKLLIKDLGSANSTLVNGSRIANSELQENDRVSLGNVEFQVRKSAGGIAREILPSTDPGDDPTLLEQTSRGHLWDTQEAESTSMMSITHSLNHTELMNLLGRSHATLDTMYRVVEMASSIFDLDVLLAKILDETFATIRAERAFILLIDPNSDELEIKASRWQDKEGLDHKISISQNIISHVLEKKESVLIADAMADSQFGLAKSVVIHKIRSAMCSPLRGRDRIVGIIHVDCSTSSGEFGQQDLMLLDAIGNAAGTAVENAQLYKEKIQNERLAAMGQAISGLSHYIKNIVAAIETSHAMMERGLDAEDLSIIHRVYKILRRSNQRISNLVMDMLAYSKERKPRVQSCQVNEICEEVAEMCQDRVETKNAQMHLALDPQLSPIEVDPQGVHRSVLNLVTNAIDALDEDEGEIRIRTRKQDESEVLISVEDNGAGIPENIYQRIFDVFFSTKGSQGTGLGLAVTKKIIEEHGGSLEAQSIPDQGTTFTIHLPIKKE